MLVLSRKPGEKVVIGANITLTIVEVRGNRVRIAFDAPDEVCILRGELVTRRDDQEPTDVDLESKPAEWKDAKQGIGRVPPMTHACLSAQRDIAST